MPYLGFYELSNDVAVLSFNPPKICCFSCHGNLTKKSNENMGASADKKFERR